MTLEELQQEVRNCLRDPSVEQSITHWLNQSVLELAGMYELPSLRLRTPATLITTEADYLYQLSDASHPQGYQYMRRLFRVTSETFRNGLALEPDPSWIDGTDYGHTQTGDSVQRVAVEGDELIVFPKASDTLQLYFYRRPEDMVQPDDSPDGIPEPFHAKVLLPFVVLKAFRVYPDIATSTMGDGTKALQLWTARLQQGLIGDTVQEGMLHAITKSQRVHTPRIKGPAYGSSLGGRYW